MKAAKKQANKEKRESKGGASSSKAKSSKPKQEAAKTLSSAGTGGSYKSKEYIESSEDSDS